MHTSRNGPKILAKLASFSKIVFCFQVIATHSIRSDTIIHLLVKNVQDSGSINN